MISWLQGFLHNNLFSWKRDRSYENRNFSTNVLNYSIFKGEKKSKILNLKNKIPKQFVDFMKFSISTKKNSLKFL